MINFNNTSSSSFGSITSYDWNFNNETPHPLSPECNLILPEFMFLMFTLQPDVLIQHNKLSPSSRIRPPHLQQQMRVQIQISVQIHLLFLQEVFKITSGTLEIIIHRMQSFLHMHIQHQETIRST